MVDILLYQGGTETLAPDGSFGAVADGQVRVLQRVAYELLTRAGTIPGKTFGTGLLQAVAGANTGVDLGTAFTIAADQIRARLQAEAAAVNGIPIAEAVTGIFLTNLTMGEGVAVLTVQVGFADGTTTATRLPVRIAPTNDVSLAFTS